MELNFMLNSSGLNPEKAKDLQKKVSDFRAKLAQERINHLLEVRKIAPDLRLGKRFSGQGKGFGPHKGGYGMFMGGYRPGGSCR